MRTVSFGDYYGTVSFPDDATDDDVVAHYNSLESNRLNSLKAAKLNLEQATDEVDRQQPTLGKLATLAGLNLGESAVGTTKQAVGNIARTLADVLTVPQEGMQRRPEMEVDTASPEHPLNILREAGKDIESAGSTQLKEAQELSEGIGGGLPGKITSGFASAAGASAPALLAAPLGLPAAALAGGAQSYGSNLSQFRDMIQARNPQLSEEEAFQQAQVPAALTGAATAVLTRAFGGVERFVDRIAKEGLKQTGVKALLREGFKTASLEFPEEALDQLAQGLTEKAFINPDKDVGDILNEAGMAGLTGFALGGLTAGAISGPVKAGEAVAGAVERSRVRRQSARESESRVKQVIQEREAQNAIANGAGVKAPGQEETLRQEADQRLRVRNTAQVGVEAKPGTAVASATISAPKEAGFGGYQFNNPDLPQYTIPGSRPGIVRHVSAQTAQAAGYTVPETIPVFEEWKAQGSPTVASAVAPVTPATQTFESRVEAPVQQAVAGLPPVPAGNVRLYHGEGGPQGGGTGGSFYASSAAKASTFGPEISWVDVPVVRAQAAFAKAKASSFGGGDNFILEAADTSRSQKLAQKIAPPTYNLDEVQYSKTAPGTPHNPISIQIQKADGTTEPAQFNGYYTPGRPSIGRFLPDGRVSHGLLSEGETIVGNVPSYEQWEAAKMQQPAVLTPQQQAQAPINWQEFSTKDKDGYNSIDPIKIRDQLITGKLQGGTVANQLLTHLLRDSSLHPLNPIRIIDISPQDLKDISAAGSPAAGGAYRGLFTTTTLSNKGNIEILTKNSDGSPVSQALFVQTLAHELVHNNITSKIKQASPELRQEAQDLYDFVKNHEQTTLLLRTSNELLNISEFFSEAMTNPGFQKYLSSLDYGSTGKANVRQSVFSAIMDLIKRIFKLPDFITTATGQKVDMITALEQVFSTAAQLEQVQRYSKAALQGQAIAISRAPAIEGLQVAGTAAEVGRIAEQIYGQREAGGQQLEGLAYQRKQFKRARSELKRLADQAYGRYGATLQEEPVVVPDPSKGVKIEDGQIVVDDTFTSTLNQVGVPHDPATVQAMQTELFFEGAARRLNNIMANIANLQQAAEYYRALKVDQSEIDKIDKTIAKLNQEAEKLIGAEHNGETVGGRSSEITAAESSRPRQMAQRDSLSLDPVADFFGRQVGGYRDFMQKAQAGLQVAQALQNAAITPEELAKLTAETERWVRLPADVQSAIRAGKPLTDEQRASAFATLSEVFDDFDITRARMMEMQAGRLPEINKEERELLLKVADSKIDKGTAEVMISDILSSLDGESGGTGNLQGQQVAQELKQRLSAIQNFALTIGKDLETNKALFQWLANPTSQNNFMISASAAYGVDQQTLAMILDEVRRNPAFGSAIVTLIESSDKKLSNMPVVQLEQIQELVKQGNTDAAKALAQQLLQQSEAHASVAKSALWSNLKALDKLNIERIALEQGSAMFSELASSKQFQDTRNAVANSPFGLVEPMVAQNNTATTFKEFGVPGIPSNPELVIGASDNPVLKSEWFHRVDRWHKAAQEHLDAYDSAEALHNADPINNPQPSALGFDLAKVRGLRDATARFVPGSFLELSLLSEENRWKVPRLVREMSKTSWFRQHDFVSKMVGGIPGTDLRGRLADFTNHFLIARSIIQKYNNIPKLLHSAMKSHPGMGMNMADYREMFNEMAHWGRMFGSPVKVGFVLPVSGIALTSEDITLLQRQRAFEDELRRRVTETTPVAGVRLRRGGRELVRAGAYVGDEGLPRHLNRQSNSFIADVVQAYVQPATGFDTSTDLSASSTNPVVAFWNRNMPLLVQHVLDVSRQDRTMKLDPFMQTVEDRASKYWFQNGTPTIQSLEELVNHLVSYAPPGTGFIVRDKVIQGLNAELAQYRNAAKGIQNERSERDQARNSGAVIAFSADNEFTKPAAKLELPSAFYDYGAITPAEHLAITSRANHERVVGYATAVQRAISEIQDRLNRFRNGTMTEDEAAKSYGGDIEEMKQVLGILHKIADDFEAAYRTNNPTQKQSQWYREGFGLLTSAVLALPTVGLRNMTQGQFETYVMSRAMGLSGHRLTMWRALKQMTKTLKRFALTLGAGAMRRVDLGASVLTGKNIQMFEKLVDTMAKLVSDPDYKASGDRVHELGYDTRDGFLDRLRRIWEETAEFSTPEQTKASTVNIAGQERRLGALAGVPVKALRAAFDKMGVQQYDQAINSSLLTYAEWLQKRLEEVAVNYGSERERQGLTSFDATDARWQLKPDEWAAFKSHQGNTDSLGLFRLFLEGSANPEGFQLERNLWDYYQKQKSGQHPRMFSPTQFDAVQRKLLAEFNASTPANRASAAAGNNVVRNLLTLQGYVSDGLLKLINGVAGGARDRSMMAATIGKLPTVALVALMSLLIGMFQGGITGEWERRIRGRAPTLPTPLDKDFWTSWKRFGEGALRLSSAQLFYIGDIILALRGEVQGNRGFDPVGRVLPISIIQRALNTVRGMWNTARGAGTAKDALVPLADFGRSMTPYWMEAENAFGAAQGAIKQGERILRGEAQVQNLLPESRLQTMTGPAYGPTTIVRRNLGEAVSAYYNSAQSNDTAGANAALDRARAEMKKLEDFYAQKYMANGDDEITSRVKAERDVWNDYQEINPVVSAMLGKRPTQAQYDLIRGNITGERAAMVDRAVNAWQSGAEALFGRTGSITREDVAGAGGGGGGIPSIGSIGSIQSGIGQGIGTAGFAAPAGYLRRGQPSYGGTSSRGPGVRRKAGVGSRIRRRRLAGVTRRKRGPRIPRTRSRTRRVLGTRRRRAYAFA